MGAAGWLAVAISIAFLFVAWCILRAASWADDVLASENLPRPAPPSWTDAA